MRGSEAAAEKRGVTVILRLAVVALAVVAGQLASELPEAVSVDASPQRFSAGRAAEHVEALARTPRPLGTPAHALVAEYLLEEMSALGLEVEEQETSWLRSSPSGRNVGARVRNLLGRWPGADADAETLLLLAHYDSQPQTPGAGDDASGVAVILEALRALRQADPLRNEVIVVFSDAEELGLIGAEAFVGEHPWFSRVDLTLNFEARGSGGPAVLFETSSGSLARVRDFAREAPYPVADSLFSEVYDRMPNDTDFSAVRRGGGDGLNFAFVHGHPGYHSALDVASALDLSTLQQEGDNALALARFFSGSSLAPTPAVEGAFFNPLGIRTLWVLSAKTVRAGGLLAALLWCVATWLLYRRGAVRLGRVSGAVGLWLAASVLAAGATWLVQRVTDGLGAGASPTPHGVPYAQGLSTLAFVCLAMAAWCLVFSAWRGRSSELLCGVALLWVTLAVASSWSLVGASHLFVGPALLLTVGMILRLRLAPRSHPWALTLLLLPVVPLWAATLEVVYLGLTVHAATLLSVFGVLAASLLTPVVSGAQRSSQSRIGWSLAASALACLGWAAWADRPSESKPRVDSLFILHDTVRGESTWRSLDDTTDSWTNTLLGDSPERRELPSLFGASTPVLTAQAHVAAPDSRVSAVVEADERPGAGRRVAVRILAPEVSSLRLWARAEVAIAAARVDGRECRLSENGELRLTFHGPPDEGLLLEIDLSDRWPVSLEIVELTYGLPGARHQSRPGDRIARPGWWTDTTMLLTGESL